MVIMLTNNLIPLSHRALLLRLGERVKTARLQKILSRRTLALRANVPESTIKRFESTGEIGVNAMLSIMTALGCSDQIESLFVPKAPGTLAELRQVPTRVRGKRSDVGKVRAKDCANE